MRLSFLLIAAILSAPPTLAQQSPSSSGDADSSSTVDKEPSNLPVSVDRIREALATAPPKPLLRGLDERPDFAVTVEERIILENFFKPEDFTVGPVPAGGLYAYEQQRVVSNSVDEPLAQPYAAFSGGELMTLAIQGLLFKYLGQEVTDRVIAAHRAHRASEARETVLKAIQAYCAVQPAGGAAIEICSAPQSPR
jgi:hypothetical protein